MTRHIASLRAATMALALAGAGACSSSPGGTTGAGGQTGGATGDWDGRPRQRRKCSRRESKQRHRRRQSAAARAARSAPAARRAGWARRNGRDLRDGRRRWRLQRQHSNPQCRLRHVEDRGLHGRHHSRGLRAKRRVLHPGQRRDVAEEVCRHAGPGDDGRGADDDHDRPTVGARRHHDRSGDVPRRRRGRPFSRNSRAADGR